MIANEPRFVALQQPQIQHEDSFEGLESDPMEEDETELELEKLVFGDEKGFHDNLKLHKKNSLIQYPSIAEEAGEKGQEEAEDQGFEGLDDSAVRTIDLQLANCRG